MPVAGQRCGQGWNFNDASGERIAAALLACALHIGVASLMWHNLPTHAPHELSFSRPMSVEFFVSPEKGEFEGQAWPSSEPTRIDGELPQTNLPAGIPASERRSNRKPATSPRPRVKQSPASRPAGSAAEAKSDVAPSPHDFAWRPSDSAAQGEHHSRDELSLRLSPKERRDRSALAREIEKASRPPCRDAHAAQGLLALPFLLADTVMDKGCKW